MKILFSPSETKSDLTDSQALSSDSLIFAKLFKKRVCVVEKLNSFLLKCDSSSLEKFFGIKDSIECKRLAKLELLTSPTCRAVERYTGIAYKYLDFKTIKKEQQEWIYENTIIFSNLFGPLLAGNYLPYYRFKQGSSIDGFKPEIFYKESFSEAIDSHIGSELIIDLRASFYERFYTLTRKHITIKFIKNGKVVSHWAKAYRGKILRDLSKHQPQNIDEFENINFSNLSIEEIIEGKIKKEYIFSIIS